MLVIEKYLSTTFLFCRVYEPSNACIETTVLPGHGGGLITPTTVLVPVAAAALAVEKAVEALTVEVDVVANVALFAVAVVLALALVLVLSSLAGQLSGLTAKHFRNNCPNKGYAVAVVAVVVDDDEL